MAESGRKRKPNNSSAGGKRRKKNDDESSSDPQPGSSDPQPGSSDPQPGSSDPQPGSSDPQPGPSDPKTIPTYEDFFMAMAFLASTRSKDNSLQVGACIVTSSPHRLVGMGYNGMPDGIGFKDEEMDWARKKKGCCAELNAIIGAFRRFAADLSSCTCYTTHSPCEDCNKLIAQSGIKNVEYALLYHEGKALQDHLGQCKDVSINEYKYTWSEEKKNIAKTVINLDKLEATLHESRKKPEERKKVEKKEKRAVDLPLDDYFMALAILATTRSVSSIPTGACVVLEEPRRVLSVGYNGLPHGHKEIAAIQCGNLENRFVCCAESNAIVSAFTHRADLTSSILYSTSCPCVKCAQTIVQSGIRTVVYGKRDMDEGDMDKEVSEIFYRAKTSVWKYKRISKKNTIEIDLHGKTVKQLEYQKRKPIPPPEANRPKPTKPYPPPKDKSTYKDFFMAMAFLACTRSKDDKTQVGACIVTPSPHRMVALGYNGMPDGRGFKDVEMEWGKQKTDYVCHAEMNAITSGFRRLADLSACTLYVTHSPCSACSKLVAQAGIKNVIFTKKYHEAKDVYNQLGSLPDMNITRYEYNACGQGNIAKIRIDLDELKGELMDSAEEPNNEDLGVSQMRDVDFPLDDYFMALAILAKTRSGSPNPVGACVVLENPRRAISVGYNGLPDARKNSSGTSYECCAEANAIVSAFRYHADLTASILYTTSQPCPKCAQMIVQSGIRTVVYGGREGDMNATVPEGDMNATASEGDMNATASEGDMNATASEGDMNATASEGDMNATASDIFYRAKTAYLKYEQHSKKRFIEIDLHGQTVKQLETVNAVV